MICRNCRAGADMQTIGGLDLDYGHSHCPGGTWCDCQHNPVAVDHDTLAEHLDSIERYRARHPHDQLPNLPSPEAIARWRETGEDPR